MSEPVNDSAIQSLLSDVSFDLGWSLIERFAILVRESGSPEERAAANFIVTRLESMDVPFDVYEPDLYLSIPRSASVELAGTCIEAKPTAFSASTGSRGVSKPPIYVPSVPARSSADLFDASDDGPPPEVKGKIVVTEGFPMPASVARFEAAGAAGQVYVNPGSRTHWGICTTIWGAPGVSQMDRKPSTPVMAISRPEGDAVLEAIHEGADRISLHAKLDEGWYPCLLPVARIDGAEEDFVLAHGHYDSWDVGIGDNAVGDATLLELVRIFHANRDKLRRSVRVAWWPGHSTGRYGGSTWYADAFALDLSRRCVATVNIDSPGCWRATEYDEVPWMAEADEVCRSSIRSVAGVEPERQRPLRAGDYSFNQLGLTSFFMLLSNIPKEERERLGFYPVGGCGGNIAWHTEKDRIDIADRANLERDLRVYLTAIGRLLTDEIIPLDFRKTAAELCQALDGYEAAVDKKRLNLKPVRKDFDAFVSRLNAFYKRIEEGRIDSFAANEALLKVGRILVHLGYAEGDRFDHDPATPRVPIPKLARIHELKNAEEASPELLPFLFTELRRQVNKVHACLLEASRILIRADTDRASV